MSGKAALNVVYVPWEGVDPDDAVRLGAAWLQEQPGQHLVLLETKQMYSNNPLLPRLTAGAFVERRQVAGGSDWRSGAILAPWPTEQVLATISDRLASSATGVCIIEWGDREFQSAWLAAHNAVNLITGEHSRNEPLLPPVIEVAMRELGSIVNHNNGLVQYYDKAYAVRTLQELVRAGYRYDLDKLCAWALSNGFTQTEVDRLREYGRRVLEGRRFQLREQVGPRPGTAKRWKEEAARQRLS